MRLLPLQSIHSVLSIPSGGSKGKDHVSRALVALMVATCLRTGVRVSYLVVFESTVVMVLGLCINTPLSIC